MPYEEERLEKADRVSMPVLNEDFSTVVVVDNIPQIKMERYERLLAVIRKIFSKYGKIINDGLYIPVEGLEGSQKTSGYCFLEYETKEMAQTAVIKGDQKKLDNKHKLAVTYFSDFEKYSSLTDEYVLPLKTDFESKSNTRSWLLDSLMRDQFVVRYGSETQVYWNDPSRATNTDGRVLVYGGEREKAKDKQWTEMYVAWSTEGSYLATFHSKGIVIWGGEDFEKLGRFVHNGVKALDFSPKEKYIVTGNMTSKEKPSDPDAIIVWDCHTFKKMRGFDKGKRFMWSHDDHYLGRIGPDVISVYETPHMGLLDKKSIKMPGVQEVMWAPDQNIMSFWVPERGNIPAKVALIELPSKKVIREKHIYNVVEMKMFWQASGDYLAVQVVTRKSKKTLKTHFEIFHMRNKDIPIEVLEMDEPVVGFSWEKAGPRFGVIHGDGNRLNVSFYKCQKKIKVLKKFESVPANCMYWSPNGAIVIVAGLGTMNGALAFVDVDSMKIINETEHFMANEIEWDPSGRYVITSVTQPLTPNGNFRYTMENGYKVWSAQGQPLTQLKVESCYQIMWRPRPKSLLSKKQKKDIQTNLKKYWKEFERQDDEIRQSQLSGAARKKKEFKEHWKTYRAERDQEFKDEAPLRRELRGGLISDDEEDFEMVKEVEEKFIEEHTDILD